MGKAKPTWHRPVLVAAAGATYSRELRSAIRWALVTIDTQQAEIKRLTRQRDELIETTTESLHHVGEHVLGERFRGSKIPLHQRLSMVVHALAAEAAGGE
jgi:hypothetical protein